MVNLNELEDILEKSLNKETSISWTEKYKEFKNTAICPYLNKKCIFDNYSDICNECKYINKK